MGSVTLITRNLEAPLDFARGILSEKRGLEQHMVEDKKTKILSSVSLCVSEPSCEEPMMDMKVTLVFNHQNRLFQTQTNSVES